MLKPTVQVHKTDQALVAEFWDCLRLDIAPVKELRSKYQAHLRSNGRPMLVVDLEGVGFAGSSALGLFVNLVREVRKEGGQIIFCNVDPTVYEVFRISKLDSMFEFVSDRAAALDLAARLDPDADASTKPAPEPTPQPTPESKPPRNAGNESVLRRHRRRNLEK